MTRSVVSNSDVEATYEEELAYDSSGNRVSYTRVDGDGSELISSLYDERDRLQSTGSTLIEWDTNGNLTAFGNSRFTWDSGRRLIQVTEDDTSTIDFVYDIDGHRVQSRMTHSDGSSQTVDYLVDTRGVLSHVVGEIVSGEAQTIYSRSADELLTLWHRNTHETRFFHADALGSIRALSDEAGNVTDTYDFTVFGVPAGRTGTDTQPYRFAGEPYSTDLGLYYNRARWFDPQSGRFLSMDPFPGFLRDPLTLHRYIYGNNDPSNRTDPSGLFAGIAGLNVGVAGRAIAGGVSGFFAMRYFNQVFSRLFGFDRLFLDFSDVNYRDFERFGGLAAAVEIQNGTKLRVEELYSRWPKLKVSLPQPKSRGEVSRTVNFSPHDSYFSREVASGAYPFVFAFSWVFTKPVAFESSDRSDLMLRLGNVAAHEAAHSMGIFGHRVCNRGFDQKGTSLCPPFVMVEGVAGEEHAEGVVWSPESKAWLDRVLGQ